MTNVNIKDKGGSVGRRSESRTRCSISRPPLWLSGHEVGSHLTCLNHLCESNCMNIPPAGIRISKTLGKMMTVIKNNIAFAKYKYLEILNSGEGKDVMRELSTEVGPPMIKTIVSLEHQ